VIKIIGQETGKTAADETLSKNTESKSKIAKIFQKKSPN
jgi:hypothetical protein